MRYLLFVALMASIGCEGKKIDHTAEDTSETGNTIDANPSPDASTSELPQGTSTLTSVEATVTGNAAEYRYAFADGLVTNCEGLTYGDYHDLSVKLTISDVGENGPKTVCIVGRSSNGTEQESPSFYGWIKTSATTDVIAAPSPKPKIELKDGQLPEEISDNSIALEVKAANGATHYHYALKQGEHNCGDFEDGDYSADKEVATAIELDDLTNGDYTLCLRGKKGDELQDTASRYVFEKVDPPPPAAAGKLRITVSSKKPYDIYFASAAKYRKKIELENTGSADLDWKISSAAPHWWLKIGTANNMRVVKENNNLLSGTLAAGAKKKIFLRLTDIYKTNYGENKKTATLRVHNVSGGDDPVDYNIHLHVPNVKLDPYPAIIKLSNSMLQGKIWLTSSDDVHWAVLHQLTPVMATSMDFTNIVSLRSGRVDGNKKLFIEATVNEHKLAQMSGNDIHMTYLLITNTRSIKTKKSTCYPRVLGGETINLVGGTKTKIGSVNFIPKFSTNVCYYFAVSVRK